VGSECRSKSFVIFLKCKIVEVDVEQEQLLVPANLIEIEHQDNEEPTK
jgi:hypothetical protein